MKLSQFETIANIAGAEFTIDAYGSAMDLFFDVARVLDASDIEGDVSPQPFTRWQYRRAPFTVPAIETIAQHWDANGDDMTTDFTYGEVALAAAYRDGQISQSDLIYAGDVLNRYTGLLTAAGLDY